MTGVFTKMQTYFFDCECGSDEHFVRFRFEPDDDVFDKVIFLTYYLDNRRGWWKRLLTAVKYVFGRRPRYGDFGETIITLPQAERLHTMLDHFITGKEPELEWTKEL